MRTAMSRCGIIALGCWRRRGAGGWSRWRRGRIPGASRGFQKKGEIGGGGNNEFGGTPGKGAIRKGGGRLATPNHHASLPSPPRLYRPRGGGDAGPRRKEARVPAEITFKTKPQIALEQIRAALLAGVAPGVVLMDASYGNNGIMRRALTGLGLSYVAAIMATTKVRHVRKDDPKPPRVSVEALALSLPKHAWRTITWREGTNEKLQSRFVRVRWHAAPFRGEARFAEETLLIEWPEGEARPTKYWLATVDRKMSFRGLVDLAKMRWRIERDYEDLKQEIGLGHYEGRRWRGFHHHGTLSIAAYGFLISERERIPPSGPRSATPVQKSPLPGDYRPRGVPAPAATPRPQLDCHAPSPVSCCTCGEPSTMPVLCPPQSCQPEMEIMT